jgi:hypothetical protein
VILQTNLIFAAFNALFCHGLTTFSWLIEVVYQFKNGIHRAYMTIRPIVCTPLLVYDSCLENTRKIFVGDTMEG